MEHLTIPHYNPSVNTSSHVWSHNETGGYMYGPEGVSLATAIPMTLIYAVIFITGIVGNICTCIVIARNKYMHTATNYYLFSLAVSDLLLLVLGLPQEIYQLWSPSPYIFGEFFCVFRGLAAETSTNASVLLITAFTIERYLAICHPLRSHTMSKLSRAIKFIIVIWVVACACAVPLAIQFGIVYIEEGNPMTSECNLKKPFPHSFELSTFLFFCLPMSLITALYIMIGMKLRHSVKKETQQRVTKPHSVTKEETSVTGTNGALQGRPSIRPQTGSSRKAVVKMLVAVVVAFFICWAPFHAQRLLAIYATAPPSVTVQFIYSVLTYLSGILYYVSATINPILYHIMSLKFRLAFKDTLARCCGRRPPRTGKFHSLSKFHSSVRSRVTLDTTETTMETLIKDDEPFEANGVRAGQRMKRKGPPHAPTETDCVSSPRNCGHARGDSISNSSLQMLDDDAFTPEELSTIMAELNENQQQRYFFSSPSVLSNLIL